MGNLKVPVFNTDITQTKFFGNPFLMPGFLVTSAFFVPVAKLFIDLGESKPPTWFLYGWF